KTRKMDLTSAAANTIKSEPSQTGTARKISVRFKQQTSLVQEHSISPRPARKDSFKLKMGGSSQFVSKQDDAVRECTSFWERLAFIAIITTFLLLMLMFFIVARILAYKYL